MSTPVAGPLVVTPVFTTPADVLVEWDDVGDTWRSIVPAGTGGSTTITLTGDVTGTGSGTVPTTLATVNSNVGTFQGLTVNGKGLVTAAVNQSYLTANQTITLSGDLTGSGTTTINAQIAANAVGTTEIANANVTYAKIQNVTNNRVLGNTSGSAAAPSEIVLPLSLANGGTGTTNALGLPYLSTGGGTVSGATTFSGTVTFSGSTSPAWLPLTGGTLSGNLTVSTAGWSAVALRSAAGNRNQLSGFIGANQRWEIDLGDATAEGGGNSGSNFGIARYNDAGAGIDYPFTITRATGNATFNSQLGVGITPANARFQVANTDSNTIAIIAGATKAIRIGTDGGTSYVEGVDNTGITSYQPLTVGGSYLRFTTSGTERVRIDTAGKVGINTTAPNTPLEIKTDNQAQLRIDRNNAATHKQDIEFAAQGAVKYELGMDINANATQTFYLYDSQGGAIRILIDSAGACFNTTGTWAAVSDAAIKSDVQPYTRGLDAVLALNPVAYRYNEKSPFAAADDPVRYGLIAQEVEPHVPEAVGTYEYVPEAVGKSGEPVELATLDPGALIYVLINAVKQLNAKVAALEAGGAV